MGGAGGAYALTVDRDTNLVGISSSKGGAVSRDPSLTWSLLTTPAVGNSLIDVLAFVSSSNVGMFPVGKIPVYLGEVIYVLSAGSVVILYFED